jgi:hypothetical protein
MLSIVICSRLFSFGNYLFSGLANGRKFIIEVLMFIRFGRCAGVMEFPTYPRSPCVASDDLMRLLSFAHDRADSSSYFMCLDRQLEIDANRLYISRG